MDETDRAILALLSERGTSPVKSLYTDFSRPTVYRSLKALRKASLVARGERRGTWELTQAGREVLDQSDKAVLSSGEITWPSLPIPHLAVLPSREHQALGRLIVLAATARRHYEHHHVSFVLHSSSGLRGKTWTGRWACAVLGAPESQALVHAVAEGGRSLGARRRASGEIASVRSALAGPVWMIDEWRRGSSEVRRLTTVLIHGDTQIPLENETLDVTATLILALNSPKTAKSVEEATGLDGAMIRRCLVTDLERVELAASFSRDGEERLDRVRELGPVTLPEIRPGQADERLIRDQIADALAAVLDSPERQGSLDLVLLGQLAVAACAWGLSVDEAVALVVHDACVVWSTTEWTAPAWEARLVEVLGRGDEQPVEEIAPKAPVPEPAVSLEYDWEARVAELDRVAGEHEARDPEELRERLELAAGVRKVGLRADDLAGLVELIRIVRGKNGNAAGRLRLLATMDALGLEPDEVESALGVLAAGRPLGLNGDDVVRVVQGIEDAGLDPVEVGAWAIWVTTELDGIDQQVAVAQAELRGWRERVLEAATNLATINARIEKLNDIIQRARRDSGLAAALRITDAEREREVVAEIFKAAREIARGQTA